MSFKKISIIGLNLAILGIAVFGFLNFQNIQDWWTLRSYNPTSEISTKADKSGMSEFGRKLYYLADPAVNDKPSFNANCPFPEKALVLGCYNGTNIYILDVKEPKLAGVEEVTAAHEMLHAAYMRLSSDEKDRVDDMLQEQLLTIKDEQILETARDYKKNDPDHLLGEMHSIIGTEVSKLSDELETYYSKYFSDRTKVLKLADKYRKVFSKLDDRIEAINEELEAMKPRIASMETELENTLGQINSQKDELDRLLDGGDVEKYNAGVGPYNQLVNGYNSAIGDLQSNINAFNSLVAELKKIALQESQLIQSLDSNFQPINN